MLEAGHTNVDRLCHLVIDDADIVTKEFPSQVLLPVSLLHSLISYCSTLYTWSPFC